MKTTLTFTFFISLLVSNWALATTPAAKEFAEGHRIKFSTAGHPKSKGLNMVISYPSSWLAKEGEHPNIVQKFIGIDGRWMAMALILTKSIPLPAGKQFSEDELREIFAPSSMKEMLPDGATFIGAKATRIEGLPAGILESSIVQETVGGTFYSQTVSYVFIFGATMVQLQCSVTTQDAPPPGELKHHMDDFRPLFLLMANSIVLPDKWR